MMLENFRGYYKLNTFMSYIPIKKIHLQGFIRRVNLPGSIEGIFPKINTDQGFNFEVSFF